MGMNLTKNEKMLLEIYKKMYKEAEPKADFDKMIKSGETKIREFFLGYYLSNERQEKIIESVCKKYKVDKMYIRKFKTEVMLGCSPTAIREVMLKKRQILS